MESATTDDAASDARPESRPSGGSTSQPPSSQPTSPSSGTTSPAPADDAQAPPPEPVVRAIPIAWDGTVPTQYCAPAGPGMCMGLTSLPALDGGDSMQDTGASGTVGASLTLSWEPAGPMTERLLLEAWSATSCGDRCWQGTGTVSLRVSGGSPLTLDLPATALAPDETLVLSVGPDRLPTPDPIYGYVATDQPFHLEGVLAVVG